MRTLLAFILATFTFVSLICIFTRREPTSHSCPPVSECRDLQPAATDQMRRWSRQDQTLSRVNGHTTYLSGWERQYVFCGKEFWMDAGGTLEASPYP